MGYLAICEAMSVPPLQIPAGLAAAYGVSQNDLRFITQVQNYIFAYATNGEQFILRLTPRTHQSPQQVVAEVDWVNDLAGRDVPVLTSVLRRLVQIGVCDMIKGAKL